MNSMRRTIALVLVPLCLMLSGCVSPPSPSPGARFFQLQPSPDQAPVAGGLGDALLVVGPVEVADYLDRPQMVQRVGAHQVAYDEFQRWAEPLRKNITWVLTENLSSLLSTENVFSFRSINAEQGRLAVEVQITRFEGRPGDRARLDAGWTITVRGATEAPRMQRVRLDAPVSGDDTESLVAAQSRLLADFSRGIALDVARTLGVKVIP